MNRRDFAKGGILAALLALIPTRLFGQKVMQGIPVRSPASDMKAVTHINCGTQGLVRMGSFAFRIMEFNGPLGGVILGHAHDRDHPTFVMAGAFKVRSAKVREKDGRLVPVEKPKTEIIRVGEIYHIEENVAHEFTKMESFSKLACGFAHYDHNGEPSDIPVDMDAYF